MNLQPGQRFRQLTLRDDVLFGDFVLESVPVMRAVLGAQYGETEQDHVMFFTGKVDGEPSPYKIKALRQLREKSGTAAVELRRAGLLKTIANPAGDVVAVPVGAVLHAVPMESTDYGAPIDMTTPLTANDLPGLEAGALIQCGPERYHVMAGLLCVALNVPLGTDVRRSAEENCTQGRECRWSRVPVHLRDDWDWVHGGVKR